MLKVRNLFVSLLLLIFLSTSFAAGLERKDAVKDQTTTTGTTTFTLANLAPAGARSISTHTSGSTVRYRAINSDGSEWEDGEGVVTNTAGTWTLTRVTVFASSNSNALTSFSAGTKSVLTIPTAKDFDVPDWATGSSIASASTINLDAATGGVVHITGTTTITTVTLTRGPRLVIFDGTLTLTHNSTTNNLPGATNIVTVAGDRALYVGDGTTAYCIDYVQGNASLTMAGGKTAVVSNSLTLAGTDSTTMTFPSTSASVGYLNIPQNSQSAPYTLVLGDAGGQIYHPSADTTARTFTIPANGSVAYPVGTAITFVNDTSAGVLTIAITTDTLVLAGAGTTGSRTLAAGNVATIVKISSTRWMISGSSGLT